MAAALTRFKNESITKIRGSEKHLSIIVHRGKSQMSFTENQWKVIKQKIFFIAFFSDQLILTSKHMAIGINMKYTFKIPRQYNYYVKDLQNIIKSDNWKITAIIYKPGGSPLVHLANPHRRRSLSFPLEAESEASFNFMARKLGLKK